MSYLPTPRGISMQCGSNTDTLVYVSVIQMASSDDNMLIARCLQSYMPAPVMLQDVLQFNYDSSGPVLTFTEPDGSTFDFLLPIGLFQGTAATSVQVDYGSGETKGGPVVNNPGTIIPPIKRPVRDEKPADPLPLIIQSVNNPANQSLMVAVSVPTGTSPLLIKDPSQLDPTKLALLAVGQQGATNDVAVFNIQQATGILSISSVSVKFPDGSVTAEVAVAGARVITV